MKLVKTMWNLQKKSDLFMDHLTAKIYILKNCNYLTELNSVLFWYVIFYKYFCVKIINF